MIVFIFNSQVNTKVKFKLQYLKTAQMSTDSEKALKICALGTFIIPKTHQGYSRLYFCETLIQAPLWNGFTRMCKENRSKHLREFLKQKCGSDLKTLFC